MNLVLDTAEPSAISMISFGSKIHAKFVNHPIPPDASVLITNIIIKKERFVPTSIFDILGNIFLK